MDSLKVNSLATLPTPPTSPTSPTRDFAAHPCSTLRRSLERELVPQDADVPEHKRFVPKSRVAALFTEDRIKEVLQCWCPDCQEHQLLTQGGDISSCVDAILGAPSKNRRSTIGAVTLFALLVHIECPSLVTCFLKRNITDHDLETSTATFNTKHVQDILGSDVNSLLAERFHWRKYKFFVPQVAGSNYEVYSQGTILPFINETLLGRTTENGEIVSEGNFGKVFSFEILDGYGEFPDFSGVRRFARKELSNTPPKRFQNELKNLEFVKRLQDDHLVKIVKAYKHGDVYNLVFPLAKTSLCRYLRDPEYQPYSNATSLAGHPVWQQLVGLARGLHRVLDFEEPTTSTGGQSLYGYHLDLKPANILVEESERLVITDFGQAEFKAAVGATSSRVPGRGGTEAYAPPEIDFDEVWPNRRYDIWSLGCVFLEVVTFVVKGRTGVLELDRLRVSKVPGTFHTDDRFFRYNSDTDSYELKPAILDHIRSLPTLVHEGSERRFLQELLRLVLHMLRVDRNSRFTSSKVCIDLSDILNRFQSHAPSSQDLSGQDAQTSCSGVEFGNDLLQKLQPISFNVERYWESGRLRFLQDGTRLRIQSLDSKASDSVILAPRSSLRLVPEYALSSPGLPRFSDATLCLFPSQQSKPDLRKCKFTFGKNVASVTALQEVLTGQEVVVSGKVKTASATIKPRKLGPKSLRIRSHSSAQLTTLGKASAVQLWRESSHADIILAHSPEQLPQSPRSQRPSPPHRRIVVYFDQSILILRIAKNVRIQQRQGDDSSASLVFIPTDKQKDPSFPIYLIQPPSADERPSFPLVREDFVSAEEERKLECSSLTIEFHSTSEADLFRRRYKSVKKQWSDEWNKLEALYFRVCPDFGYART